MCAGTVRAPFEVSLADWINRQIRSLGPVPAAFYETIEELRYTAFNASGHHGAAFTTEAERREIRSVLKELIDDLRGQIACYRVSLALHDTMIESDIDPGCTREQLIAEMAEYERHRLADLLARPV
jgi:hypothetical protein